MTKFLFKTGFFLFPVLIGFEILFRFGVAPNVTSSMSYDTKMLWLQKHPLKEVKLIAVGSSITMTMLNSRIITRQIDLPYYNFGSWNMQMGDTKAVLPDFLRTYHPQYVLMCSSLGDFRLEDNPTYVNYTEANRFIRDHCPECFYFIDYHSIHQMAIRKYKVKELHLDPWGATNPPFDRPANTDSLFRVLGVDWNQYMEFGKPIWDLQYRQLDSLCEFLQQQKVKLVFVQPPIRPYYLRPDSLQRLGQAHFKKCRSIVESHGGAYFNYYDTTVFKDSLFLDPIHLTGRGSELFTQKVVTDLKEIIK